MESIVDAGGRIVLPVQLRRKFGIQPGMKIILTDMGDSILLLPVRADQSQQIEDRVRNLLERRRSDTKPLPGSGG